MVKADDPYGFEVKLQNQLRLLKESEDITSGEKGAIEDFAEAHKTGRVPDDEELALTSIWSYVRNLRVIAEGTDMPIHDCERGPIRIWMKEYSYQYSASQHNQALCALTAFDNYHDLGLRTNGKDDFEYVSRNRDSIDEDRVFSHDEVNEMLDNATVREQAIIAVLADTGCRIGALCSFRNGDLDLEKDVPRLAFNTNAFVKGATGKILLTWSAGHIETYLTTEHPRRDDPEAPLFHKEQGYEGDEDDGAISPSRVHGLLKDLARNSGIPRDRMKAHNFRHTAVSTWIRQGFTPQDIVHMASWADPQMLERYDNVTDEQMNEDLAVRMGLKEESDVATDPSEALQRCGRCGEAVRPNATFCGKCGLRLSPEDGFDTLDSAALEEDPDNSEPSVPDSLWSDGTGDILDEMTTETLLRELVEREDIDPSDLRTE